MVFNQKIASIGLTGYFGAIFLVAAPQLSVGLLLTYGLISTALAFGIVAISKAVGDESPDNGSRAAPRHSDNPPPYVPHPLYQVESPHMVYVRRPVIQPFFQTLFSSKPAPRVVAHRIEASRAHPLPLPSAPLLAQIQAPIVSSNPFNKPAPRVVGRTLK